jgi:hypothetical protein
LLPALLMPLAPDLARVSCPGWVYRDAALPPNILTSDLSLIHDEALIAAASKARDLSGSA